MCGKTKYELFSIVIKIYKYVGLKDVALYLRYHRNTSFLSGVLVIKMTEKLHGTEYHLYI